MELGVRVYHLLHRLERAQCCIQQVGMLRENAVVLD